MLRDGRFSAEGEVVEVPESWTPEHSVLAGLLDCSLTSLRYHALRLGVAVHAEGSARGEITKRDDGRYGFVSIEVRFDVALDPKPGDDETADLFARRSGIARGRIAEAGALVHLERCMRLLLLGGAKFVGRALIEAAHERGHAVTTFNRGQTNPGAFPEVEELTATGTATSLRCADGRGTPCSTDRRYIPQVVRSAAELLADSSSGTPWSRRSPSTRTTHSRSRRTRRSSNSPKVIPATVAARLRELRPAQGPVEQALEEHFAGGR